MPGRSRKRLLPDYSLSRARSGRPFPRSGPPPLNAHAAIPIIARIQSFAFSGIEAVPVEVQVQISAGLPAFLMVGKIDRVG
jgi:hypothetical protein